MQTIWGWGGAMLKRALENLGNRTIQGIWRMGFATRFFFAVLMHSGTAFRRFGLTIREMYFTGVLSLIIILVSGAVVVGGTALRIRAVQRERAAKENHEPSQ